MPLPITALYAGIFALWMTAIAINVTAHRVKFSVGVGDGGNPTMLRMMRLHANAAEYLPTTIVLMGIYELNGGSHLYLHIAGIAMIAARLAHASALWQSANVGFARRFGQGLTWLVIVALAIVNLLKLV
jgi:uncharacterized membrane protein YecN with MAPEG domain